MSFSISGPFTCSIICKANNHTLEAQHIRRAATIADKSAGFTSPHPNFGCVIAMGTNVIGEGFLYAQGTKCAELQAVEAAGELCRNATAYLNMEPGDCHGDHTAVSSLVKAGISRVVVGMRHPLQHLRGKAIRSLRSEGLQVDVLGEDLRSKTIQDALKSCFLVNAPLLYRAASRVPFSVLKYAMTLDGKIAASSGHASWISSKESRHRVFELRGRSDAIIVGGNTVRRDGLYPHLITDFLFNWMLYLLGSAHVDSLKRDLPGRDLTVVFLLQKLPWSFDNSKGTLLYEVFYPPNLTLSSWLPSKPWSGIHVVQFKLMWLICYLTYLWSEPNGINLLPSKTWSGTKLLRTLKFYFF